MKDHILIYLSSYYSLPYNVSLNIYLSIYLYIYLSIYLSTLQPSETFVKYLNKKNEDWLCLYRIQRQLHLPTSFHTTQTIPYSKLRRETREIFI